MPTADTATPSEISRLVKFIAVSLAIHVAILVITSLPFILRGFKPAPGPVAPVAAPAKPATPAAKPGEAKPEGGDAAKPDGTAAKPGAKKGPKDPDAEYGKDKTASPDELKTGGPSIDSELGK